MKEVGFIHDDIAIIWEVNRILWFFMIFPEYATETTKMLIVSCYLLLSLLLILELTWTFFG